MTQYILIALVALAILGYVGWRLAASNMAVDDNTERIVPDNAAWNFYGPPQVVININPHKGDDLPPA